MEYQVGNANEPKPTDKTYDDFFVACQRADELAQQDKSGNTAVAVWDKETCEMLRLFFVGQEFKPD